jgi:hypothetical protein
MEMKQFIRTSVMAFYGFDLIQWNNDKDKTSYSARKAAIMEEIPNVSPDEAVYLFDEIQRRCGGQLNSQVKADAVAMINKSWDVNPIFGKKPEGLTEVILDSFFAEKLEVAASLKRVPSIDYEQTRRLGNEFLRDQLLIFSRDLMNVEKAEIMIDNIWRTTQSANGEIAEYFVDFLQEISDKADAIQSQGLDNISGFQHLVRIFLDNFNGEEFIETISDWDILHFGRMILNQNTAIASRLTEELSMSFFLDWILFCLSGDLTNYKIVSKEGRAILASIEFDYD